MSWQTKLRWGWCGFTAGMLIVGAAGFVWAQKPDKEQQWFVRPVNPEKVSVELFRAIGVDSAGFEFRVPAGKKAIFIAVARDAEGKVIESLSARHALTPRGPDEVNVGGFRLTRVDPSAMIESYQGKVRWLIRWERASGGGGLSSWEENHFVGSNTVPGWSKSKQIDSPELGKEYPLCEMVAHPKGLRSVDENSPTMFALRISFKFEDMGQDDLWGSTFHGIYDDE